MLWGYGALAMLGIYALLAISLRSYAQPLIIMLAISFGFIGAALGHLLLRVPLTLESYVALFAVGGSIVINDSLILVAKINSTLQAKAPIYKAVIVAGKTRFRAIFLTTATTFAGVAATDVRAKSACRENPTHGYNSSVLRFILVIDYFIVGSSELCHFRRKD